MLCIKFDKDWDVLRGSKGIMVSGSSDRTVCVWDIWAGPEGSTNASVREILRDHMGGVLNQRIDEIWIVSWCVCCALFLC